MTRTLSPHPTINTPSVERVEFVNMLIRAARVLELQNIDPPTAQIELRDLAARIAASPDKVPEDWEPACQAAFRMEERVVALPKTPSRKRRQPA